MNRRSFFSIVAAVVVAPQALWAMVKGRQRATFPEDFDLSPVDAIKWSNKVNPPLTADEMRERLRRRMLDRFPSTFEEFYGYPDPRP